MPPPLLNDVVCEFECPITKEMCLYPVFAEDGRCYERDAILRWFRANAKSCARDSEMLGGCDIFTAGCIVRSPVTNLMMGTRLVRAVQVDKVVRAFASCGR